MRCTGGRQGETGKTGRKQFCVTPVSRHELCERPDKTVRGRLTHPPGMGEHKNVGNELERRSRPEGWRAGLPRIM